MSFRKLSIQEFIENESLRAATHEITDFTLDGECSSCGSCCSDFLPVSAKDIRKIKAYIRKCNIKAHSHVPVVAVQQLDFTCPFRNEGEKRCDIYDVRPAICKSFLCNYEKERNERVKDEFHGRYKAVSMRETFFNDPRNSEYMRSISAVFGQMEF